jgi:hypothetical protein
VIGVDSVKAANACGTNKIKGTDWTSGNEMVKAIEYLRQPQVQSAKAQHVDAVAIFATPFNQKGSCHHAVTICWLCAPCPHQTPLESSQLYSFLTGFLPRGRGGLEISRVGGSNGMAHCSKEFFSMLHLPVITPRKSCAVMWYPMDTKWLFFYISPYKKVHTLACHAYS